MVPARFRRGYGLSPELAELAAATKEMTGVTVTFHPEFRFSDWQGQPANHVGATSMVACAPELHDEVIRLLNP